MTNLLQRPTEMSVADRNLDTSEEENTMTATTTFELRSARRSRPHGLDRAIMRLSLTTLLWARRHADRTAVTRDEQMLQFRAARDVELRERGNALLAARVR